MGTLREENVPQTCDKNIFHNKSKFQKSESLINNPLDDSSMKLKEIQMDNDIFKDGTKDTEKYKPLYDEQAINSISDDRDKDGINIMHRKKPTAINKLNRSRSGVNTERKKFSTIQIRKSKE